MGSFKVLTGESLLPQIILALGPTRRFPSVLYRREQNRREDTNYQKNNHQLKNGKATTITASVTRNYFPIHRCNLTSK
jgi:hypothetical protein